MASTEKVEVGYEDWTLIGAGASNIALQLMAQGDIELYLGDSEPGEDDVGLIVSNIIEGLPKTISLASIPDTAGVYVRSNMEKAVSIIVMAY